MVISPCRPERLGELSIRGDASVRADCTAVTHHRRRNGCHRVAILAAMLFASGALPALPASSTASVDPKADVVRQTTTLPYEIRMVSVPDKGEGMEFAARLAEDGGLILRPIEWQVRRLDGEIVYSRARPVAAFDAEPGDYVVEASYGPLRLAETVTLVEGYRLGITFILNMGGIRVLPRLEGLGTPATRILTSIYAAGGQGSGRLVAISENPGEIVRLSAGRYRIESRFSPGNAVTTTEISVKPGLMSAVEVDHHAALARLALDTQDGEDVIWQIVPTDGVPLPNIAGNRADVVLAPGTYRISASAGSTARWRTITLHAGEAQTIDLRERGSPRAR